MTHRADAIPSVPPEPTGIVSVNSRGGSGSGLPAKTAFVALIVGLVTVGSISGYKRFHDARKTAETPASSLGARSPSTSSKPRKLFASQPTPLQVLGETPDKDEAISPCPDGGPAQVLMRADGQAVLDSTGKPLQVCKTGQLVPSPDQPVLGDLPNSAPAQSPSTVSGNAPPRASRFGGDIALNSEGPRAGNSPGDTPFSGAEQVGTGHPAYATDLSRPEANGAFHRTNAGTDANSARSQAATASFIGDRDMLVPKGRSIDCNLSMRLVTEVSGIATCVLSSHVYSDSGRVVLAERGSTVTGDYTALGAQGQRRIVVLWTRLQTPQGVIIDINSPAADALGTSGLPGEVDNRWRDRIGAAVLLSLVEDAIGYQTAKASATGTAGAPHGIAIFENSTSTGRSLAERILESTINIKPTVYKRQGDRATIFVSRDLDFGGVYALRAK